MNLQYAILGLLTYFPLTGYNLGKIFAGVIENFWHASLSQIYRELADMEKKGLVTSSIEAQNDRPDRRVYGITVAGREIFASWLNSTPESYTTPRRDAFSLRIFFSAKMSPNQLKEQLSGFLDERHSFERKMAEAKAGVSRIVATFKTPEEEDLGMRFMTRRAELTNLAMIQWAEECLQELGIGKVSK
jgi:PadR family transcriptional regulator, regulatory protein AphA